MFPQNKMHSFISWKTPEFTDSWHDHWAISPPVLYGGTTPKNYHVLWSISKLYTWIGRYKRLKSEKTEKAEITEIWKVTFWWVTHIRVQNVSCMVLQQTTIMSSEGSSSVMTWGCQAWVKMRNGDAACMRARGTHIWIGGGVSLEAQNPYPYV